MDETETFSCQELVVASSAMEQESGKQSRLAGESRRDISDAYASIATVAALLFGFAAGTVVSVQVAFPPSLLQSLYFFALTFSASLSAFSLIVMSISYYHIRNSRSDTDEHLKGLDLYWRKTWVFRHWARRSTWLAVLTYMLALGLFAFDKLGIMAAIASSLVLGISGLAVLYTVIYMTALFKQHTKESSDKK
eukprot:gb/GEZN01021403.1/.p1 GENE.gb/GEZN01021403.1/~~gb/GEZN01021403.1/.p1  ORF type:complete len:193 (+),score=21.45 gb/GEZN01021403.1/:38-616(+)